MSETVDFELETTFTVKVSGWFGVMVVGRSEDKAIGAELMVTVNVVVFTNIALDPLRWYWRVSVTSCVLPSSP